LRPISPRMASRNGSEFASSASYPQLLIAASTVNKDSLLSRVTAFCAAAQGAHASSSSGRRRRRLRNAEAKEETAGIGGSSEKVGLLKFKRFPPEGQTSRQLGPCTAPDTESHPSVR